MANHRLRRRQPQPRKCETKLGFESLESRQLLSANPLVISEFMASNDDALLDGEGNSSDWIEIHNPSLEPVSLKGWYLSDEPDQLNQWALPNATLGPDEYLVVFASGQSNEQYVDAVGYRHTNFRLNKEGEYLALSHIDADRNVTIASVFAPQFPPQFEDVSYGTGIAVAEETLIRADALSQFLVPQNSLVDDVWTEVDFDASAWATGPMGIGYENSPADYASLLRTRLPLGTDGAYVRVPFEVQDTAEIDSLTLRVRYDDGFIAYLNGEPLPGVRRNAPANTDFRSVATGNHPDADAVEFVEFDITGQLGLLQDGVNVLALHSLNQASSSDMLIMAEVTATRPSTEANVSRGYFVDPTPGRPNTTGLANPGPAIQDVTRDVGAWSDSEDLVVQASVRSLSAPVSQVKLHYRVNYGAETTLVMTSTANERFAATIPSSAAAAGDMLRWYVTATDLEQAESRSPAFLDSTGNGQSPAYYGTVIADTFDTDLPVFQWFTEDTTAANRRTGTRASVFYAGRFYDNVFVRQRGGATNASQSQKFDFNRDHGLWVSDSLGTVGEININGNGSDPSYLRQPMGFSIHTAAGGAASASFFTYLTVNGRFDRIGVWIEQVDGDFLERHDYDPDGDLYKLVQRSNLQPAVGDTTTGVEKKTGDEADLSSFAALVRGVEGRTEDQRQRYLRDHLDLAQVINYMAVRSLQHQADDVRKNIYLYNDTQGDALWRIFPWDLDWTFDIVGGHDNQDSQRTEHPFWGVQDWPTADGFNQWNKLYEALFETIEVQQMFLRRLRTLMDAYYGGPQGGTTWFADYVNRHFPQIDPYLGSSVTSGKNSLLRSIEDRRRELYSTYTQSIPGYSVVIPDAQPARPQINFGAVDVSPESGNQDEEYLELSNPNDFAVDISGWKLSGGITHQFQPGTVIAPGNTLLVTASIEDFRSRMTGPRGGQSLFVQEWNSGHLSNFVESVELTDLSGDLIATLTYDAQPTQNQRWLRATELHYHPRDEANATSAGGETYEFIELMNVSETETLDLAGVYFSEGIDFQFPDEEPFLLSPREIVLIAADAEAFLDRFATGASELRIVGEFQNATRLANGGERIKLEDSDGNTILDFRYDDQLPWPTQADGAGASLQIVDWVAEQRPSESYNDPANWRASDPSPGEYTIPENLDFLGDADRDGAVTFADFLILSGNFGMITLPFEQGDFNGNGEVDFADFLILSANFGKRNE